MLFAAIADDFTGGSDLAGMLFEQGVRTVLLFGVTNVPEGYDAAVLCLKTRSASAAQARALSVEALGRLRERSPRQVQFKYCSTFDSTPEGNIGPVIDELLNALDASYTVAVPALPVNGRTQYLGHLFVNGVLLNESPMRHHP
ncbi:MAG: four-carbon acid sugar kinase family protein, partial [Bryobacterales bacterium]|nr:four-carbon acid sugar kinase family protein [Bryobacterales bacterium]